MKWQNDFKNIDEQVKILSKRGLHVDDKNILSKINYSHLIYKYGSLYLKKDHMDIEYKDNTSLTNIYNLFLFNNKASLLLLEFFISFEHQLKASTAHHISSIDPLYYLDKNNFSCEYSNNNEINDFTNNMRKLNDDKKDKYEPKFLKNGSLPIWLIIDEMAFGQIRMLLKLSSIQNDVLKDFKWNSSSWKKLKLINGYRNLISHANPISKVIIVNKSFLKLKDLIWLIKDLNPKVFNSIESLINGINFNDEFNLSKEEVLGYLDIAKFFL